MLLNLPKSRERPVQRNRDVNAGDKKTSLFTEFVHYTSKWTQGEETQSVFYNHILTLTYSGSWVNVSYVVFFVVMFWFALFYWHRVLFCNQACLALTSKISWSSCCLSGVEIRSMCHCIWHIILFFSYMFVCMCLCICYMVPVLDG